MKVAPQSGGNHREALIMTDRLEVSNMTVCNYITDVWADMNTLPQVKPTAIPSKRSAATIYLASLAPSGRRSINGRLQSIADMFNCP